MTRLAVGQDARFEVCLADAPRASGLPNYTLETLRGLRSQMEQGGALFCLMGADAFVGLRSWHGAAEIPFVAPLIVASRPGEPLDRLEAALPDGLALEAADDGAAPESGVTVRCFDLRNSAGKRTSFYLLPGLDVDVSASEIRRQVRGAGGGGRKGEALVPGAVGEYIREHRLYR